MSSSDEISSSSSLVGVEWSSAGVVPPVWWSLGWQGVRGEGRVASTPVAVAITVVERARKQEGRVATTSLILALAFVEL